MWRKNTNYKILLCHPQPPLQYTHTIQTISLSLLHSLTHTHTQNADTIHPSYPHTHTHKRQTLSRSITHPHTHSHTPTRTHRVHLEGTPGSIQVPALRDSWMGLGPGAQELRLGQEA